MSNADYYSYARDDLSPFIPSSINYSLDVGCASGIFSENLKKEQSAETWGIEMVREVAEIAETKLDKVLVGSFDEVCDELPENYFDCIFFNDVLEHMPYPEDCLTKIKNNIRQDGHIVASLPNMRYIEVLMELILKKDWKYKESGIQDKTHLRFFTKKSIQRMFDDCGYKINRIEGINGVSPLCLTSVLNVLTFNWLQDVKYKQYVVVASPK